MTQGAPSPTRLKLPDVLDVSVAATLAGQLQALRGRPLTLDASDVQRIGGLSLQVLLSARVTWAADHNKLSIVKPSPAFREALDQLGAASLITGNA